ncbi:MAG: sugar phosphate isomerase/epimerase [Alkalibacterium sp.]|nr:sugar phosphate isomerase/epimerase [Alkalibacterium sp.]
MTPLNLGIRAHDLGPADLETLVSKLKHYGLTHVQFAIKKSFPNIIDSYDKLTPGTASFFSNRFNQEGIKISILGCYVNIVDSDSISRKQALSDFTKHLSLSGDFNASMVGTETGSVKKGYTTDNFKEEAFLEVVKSVKDMVKSAELFGTTVAIEAGINHPLHTAQLAKRLVDEVQSDNLKIILDAANLMRPENHARQAEVIEEALDLLDQHIIAMHIKDYIIEDGAVKIVPVGHGEMVYDQLLKYVKYKKPLLYVSLEATREPELKESIQLLKDVYAKV